MSETVDEAKKQIKVVPNKPVNDSGYVYAGRKYSGSMTEIYIQPGEVII